MRNRYHWIMSSTLIPETARFDNPDESHRILELSLAPRRTFFVIGGVVTWILVVVFACRTLAAPLGVPPWVAQVAIQPVGMLVGFYWLFNFGLRKPFQRTLREALQRKGVPICLKCGYDLRGQTEPRCPECGTPFDAELIDGAKKRGCDMAYGER